MRPRLLDLFCGAGGAAMGYHRAGFDVTGIDIKPQPHYPFTFVQADALEYVRGLSWVELMQYAAIHASPPCQAYSVANNVHKADHPMLLAATREALRDSGLPYVIENVEGARNHMTEPYTICGLSLGLNVKRHRLFETNVALLVPPCHSKHDGDWLGVYGGCPKRRRKPGEARRRHALNAEAQEAMGIDWMNRDELSEAIPPAYTELVGSQLLASVPLV